MLLLLRAASGCPSHVLAVQARLSPRVWLAVRCVFREEAAPSVALLHSRAGPRGDHRSLAFLA